MNEVSDNAIGMCEECQQTQVVEDGEIEHGDSNQHTIIVNELLMYVQYHMSMTASDVRKKNRSVGFIIQAK